MTILDRVLDYIQSPVDTASQLETWRERILLIILRIGALGGFFIYLLNIVREYQANNWSLMGAYTIAFGWIAVIAIFKHLPYRFRAISLLLILYGLGVLSSFTDMYAGANKMWFSAFVLLTGILLGTRTGLLAIAISTGSLLLLGHSFKVGLITSRKIGATIQAADFPIWRSTTITFFVLQVMLVSALGFIINNLARNLEHVTALSEELKEGKDQLEKQAEHLKLQTKYLKASETVTHSISSILSSEEIYQLAADLIQEQFKVSHVDLFQYHPEEEELVLTACSGDHWNETVSMNDEDNMIQNSIISRKTLIVKNIGVADMPLGTIKLLNTRSAVSIPLQSRGDVLGALVIQEDFPNAFPDLLLSALNATADRLAAAADIANLYEETEKALDAEREAYGEWSRTAWQKALQEYQHYGFHHDGKAITPLKNSTSAPPSDETSFAPNEEALQIPIVLYGQTLGYVEAKKPPDHQEWTETEIDLLKTVTERLEVALDSARLYEETQKRAEGERIIGEVTSRLRETLDIDTVLKTAAVEMRSVLDLAEVEVCLTSQTAQNQNPDIENGS